MNRLNVIQTANGWLVISGDTVNFIRVPDETKTCHTFNSLDKAVAHIRKTIKAWHNPDYLKPK